MSRRCYQVRLVDGVPKWFTMLNHYVVRGRCRKQGHSGLPEPGGCCVRCGYVWFSEIIT